MQETLNKKEVKNMPTIQIHGLIQSHIRSIETLVNYTKFLNPIHKREIKTHLNNLEYTVNCGYSKLDTPK